MPSYCSVLWRRVSHPLRCSAQLAMRIPYDSNVHQMTSETVLIGIVRLRCQRKRECMRTNQLFFVLAGIALVRPRPTLPSPCPHIATRYIRIQVCVSHPLHRTAHWSVFPIHCAALLYSAVFMAFVRPLFPSLRCIPSPMVAFASSRLR